MKAFHGSQEIKDKYLARVRAHALADEIVTGQYWEDGKGCAVGCTIHSSDHAAYETELGIPEWLARLEDTLFEGMPNERAKKWPEEFLSAIPVGVNLDAVKTPFLILVLESCLESLSACEYDEAKFPDVKAAIDGSRAAVLEMIRCHREEIDKSAARSAARSAESAAWSAESAASAAWSAARFAESAAWCAARSAARSAESAAESAESAAWCAARSAAESAASAARFAESKFEYFADQLLRLIRELGENP